MYTSNVIGLQCFGRIGLNTISASPIVLYLPEGHLIETHPKCCKSVKVDGYSGVNMQQLLAYLFDSWPKRSVVGYSDYLNHVGNDNSYVSCY